MKKYLSEFLGTFFLVFLGCASAVFLGSDPLIVAFVFGFTVLLSASSLIGKISGAHLNPAVTLAFLMNKKITSKDAVGYIIAQFIGGIVAAFALNFLVGQTNLKGLGANGYDSLSASGATLTAALFIEILATAIFTFVIMHAATSSSAGFVIGLTLTALILVLFNVTGASLNPARSFGPALLTGGTALSQVWVFIIAPTLGGLLGGLGYKFLNEIRED